MMKRWCFLLFLLQLLVGPLGASAQPQATLNVSARGADIREVLRAISIQHEVNIVPDATVTGNVTIHLTRAPFEEGLFTLLDVHGFQYTQEGSIYRVTRKPQGHGSLDIQMHDGRMSIVAEDADVRQMIRELGEKANVNITLDGPVQGQITARLTDLEIDAAVRSLFATNQQFLLRKREEVYHLAMRPARSTSRQLIFYSDSEVSLDLVDASVTEVLRDLAEQAGIDLVFVSGRGRAPAGGVTMKVQAVSLTDALELITAATGLAYRQNAHGIYLVGDPGFQPGVENPVLEQKVIWLKYLKATELPNLLPRDIPAANLTIDPARNVVVAIGEKRMIEKLERFVAEFDIETDAIRSRLDSALLVEFDEHGLVTIDAKNASFEEIVRELVIAADVDLTLFGATAQPGQVAPGLLQGRINLRIRDATLDEAMKAVFAPTGYTYQKTTRGDRHHYLVASGGLSRAGQNPLLVTKRIPLKYLNASTDGNLLALLPSTIPAEQIKLLPEQNALAVIGTPKMVQEVADYLQTIDSPAPQLMIEVTLLEVRRGDTLELGLNVSGEQDEWVGSSAAGLGLRFDTLAKVPRSFSASLQALVRKNRARVLASPRVAVLNGQEATIRVGIENLFETTTEILRGGDIPIGGITRQSFNTIKTGITLRLKPWVGATGNITMEIHSEIRDGSQITREASTIIDRSVDTKVQVPDGGMIVIGGLLQEREETVKTGVPVLSSIPLLGGLFRDTKNQSSQTELIVLIRPKVMPR